MLKHILAGLAAGAGIVAGAWYYFSRPKHDGPKPAADHGDPAPKEPVITVGGIAAPLGTNAPPPGWTGSWGYSLPVKAVHGETVKEVQFTTGSDVEWVS